MLLFMSVGKSVLPVSFVTDHYGYDYGWFLCLFLIAAYLRMYGCRFLGSKRSGGLLYIGMGFCIFAASAAAVLLSDKADAFAYYADMPYTYNHIFCLLGAVGLFGVFARMKIREGRAAALIRRLSRRRLPGSVRRGKILEIHQAVCRIRNIQSLIDSDQRIKCQNDDKQAVFY